MAQLIINIPDDQVSRINDAFASRFEWDGSGTKSQFTKRTVIGFIKEIVREVAVANAQREATSAARGAADPDLT